MNDRLLYWLRKLWWIVLLVIGSVHLCNNYSRIAVNPNSFDIIIMLSTLLLAFMPLVSEISAFGMSVKKEIIDTKREVKNEIAGIRNDVLSLAMSNSNTANQNVNLFGKEMIPLKEEVENAIKQSTAISEVVDTVNKKTDIIDEYPVSEKQLFLFKTRYALEQSITQLSHLVGIIPSMSMVKTASILRHKGIISSNADILINKVSSICNRGIHGEVVDDEYLDYVRIVLKELEGEFKKAQSQVKDSLDGFIVCPRCGYNGSSEYDNQCPKCGLIPDEY